MHSRPTKLFLCVAVLLLFLPASLASVPNRVLTRNVMRIIYSATYTINVYFSFASGIIEEGGTREHAFGLVTAERTFHLTAETAMDKKYIHTLQH